MGTVNSSAKLAIMASSAISKGPRKPAEMVTNSGQSAGVLGWVEAVACMMMVRPLDDLGQSRMRS